MGLEITLIIITIILTLFIYYLLYTLLYLYIYIPNDELNKLPGLLCYQWPVWDLKATKNVNKDIHSHKTVA